MFSFRTICLALLFHLFLRDAQVIDAADETCSKDSGSAAATTAPNNASPQGPVDYLIIGGGGSGIQMALFLKKYGYSYSILEKEAVPGSFWNRFPVFRELISVNKWTREEKHKLRYDWHSMLEAPLEMLDITEAYFPTGSDWQRYMSEVVRLADLNIEYGSEVDRLVSNQEGKPCAIMVNGTERCAKRRIFVATGLREKKEPLLEALGAIPYSQMTKAAARRKRVCIFGNGNAGFETAQNTFDVADKVSTYGKKALRLASVTKSVGDVRTKFLQVLENFHFKLRDTVDQADKHLQITGLGHVLEESQLQMADHTIDAANIMQRDACEVSVIATGFESHVPGMELSSRFPKANQWYESTEIPGIHYIGWLMHEKDFRRSSGGFLAGYRYLIRNLVHHIRAEDDGIEYPRLTLTKEEVVHHVAHRLDLASDLIILQGGIVLRDVIVPVEGDTGLYHYYEGAIYEYLDVADRNDVIYLYFMWGEGNRAQDVFENINRYTDTKSLRNIHIHPAIEINGYIRELEEDIAVDWSGFFHSQPIEKTIRAALDGNTTNFQPKPQTQPYARTVVNSTDAPSQSHEVGVGEGSVDFIPPEFLSAIVKSILSNFASEDLHSLSEAAKEWVPSMFS